MISKSSIYLHNLIIFYKQNYVPWITEIRGRGVLGGYLRIPLPLQYKKIFVSLTWLNILWLTLLSFSWTSTKLDRNNRGVMFQNVFVTVTVTDRYALLTVSSATLPCTFPLNLNSLTETSCHDHCDHTNIPRDRFRQCGNLDSSQVSPYNSLTIKLHSLSILDFMVST